MEPLLAIAAKLNACHWIIASVTLVSLLAFGSKRVFLALVLRPTKVREGQLHRLLTAGWIHGDAMHLLTNMFVLWAFSDRVLERFGWQLYVALYVSAVVMAHLPTTVRHRNNPRYGSLGASGATAAVLFSAILLDPMMRMFLMFIPIPVPGIVFAPLYLAYSAYYARGSDDGINHDAHFAGAAYGVIATAVWAPNDALRTWRTLLQLVGL